MYKGQNIFVCFVLFYLWKIVEVSQIYRCFLLNVDGKENNHVIEYSLKLDSNPEFTSSVIVAYARAAYRMYKEGQKGCKTVFDVAPAYLSALDGAELRKNLL